MPSAPATRHPARKTPSTRLAEVILLVLAPGWAGLLLGVSFLATLAKFNAPSLSLPEALDVGRHTFQALLRVEGVLAGIVVACLVLARPRRAVVIAWLAILVLQLVETVWLLRVLDRRVAAILAGGSVPASHHHLTFMAVESARVLLLSALAFAGAWAATSVTGSGGSLASSLLPFSLRPTWSAGTETSDADSGAARPAPR